jgi:phage FluMu protein Com
MKLEIQTLRCSACNKRFQVVSRLVEPRFYKAQCPHCDEKYVHDGKEWKNATLIEEKRNAKTDN